MGGGVNFIFFGKLADISVFWLQYKALLITNKTQSNINIEVWITAHAVEKNIEFLINNGSCKQGQINVFYWRTDENNLKINRFSSTKYLICERLSSLSCRRFIVKFLQKRATVVPITSLIHTSCMEMFSDFLVLHVYVPSFDSKSDRTTLPANFPALGTTRLFPPLALGVSSRILALCGLCRIWQYTAILALSVLPAHCVMRLFPPLLVRVSSRSEYRTSSDWFRLSRLPLIG